ncbi:MAG: adenylate/guanylate cyclase domain-containing protein [Planctomycetota bacterium]|nr:adenylate/guanylate cyclase domain-containing protein [Planctomycetota bacterium]
MVQDKLSGLRRKHALTHRVLPALITGALCAVIARLLFLLPVLQSFENLTLDARFMLAQKSVKPSDEIVIVLVDDTSLAFMAGLGYRWPWDRFCHKAILEMARKGGAKAVVFDIIFSEPKGKSDEQFAAEMKNITCLLPIVFGRTAAQETLGEAERRDRFLTRIFVTPQALFGPGSHAPSDPTGSETPKERFLNRLEPQQRVLVPTPVLAEACAGAGAINVFANPLDSVVRTVTPFFRYNDRLFPCLAIATTQMITGTRASFRADKLTVLGRELSLTDEGEMLIWWYGPEFTFTRYGAGAVIDSYRRLGKQGEQLAVDPSVFKDKIVLVGVNATGVGETDIHPTPVDKDHPGPEIQATILSNFLQGDSLARAPVALEWALALVLCLATATFVTMSHAFWRGVVFTILPLAGYLVAAYLVFVKLHVWLEVAAPMVGVVFAFANASAVSYFIEGRHRLRIKRMFGMYVAPEFVEELVLDSDKLRPDVGQRVELSVMFSDVRGFTTLSETLKPGEVVSLLNEYLAVMVEIIWRRGGTVDKFIGDGIMAFFGAPRHDEKHAATAVVAACEMQQALSRLQAKWKQEGKPLLKIGVGVHTGEMVVGNIGCEQKISYTVIGDNVNLTSRLEGLTKQYGAGIIVSGSTRAGLDDRFVVRELDLVRVKGKKIPVAIYEALNAPDLEASGVAGLKELAAMYEQALALYRSREWTQAEGILKRLFEKFPGDGPSKLLLEKCRRFMESPPPADWDTATNLETK